MSQAFSDELNVLSGEMRDILLDDMVCAFENRLRALARAEATVQFALNFERIEGINAAKLEICRSR